ncbi:MAG: FHA domain-containing protein [Lachnospiraceae bacterium]|nr:FHA domain-containing protein [Lachnospiraceae bacterium]
MNISAETFEFLSIIMRYWFLFLILLILYHVIKNAIAEYRFTKRNVESNVVHLYWLRLLECPDEQLVGNMVGLRHSNIIGCSKTCDVVLPYDGVSKNHCLMKYDGEGFYIKDLKSQYGTFINGEEIKRHKIHVAGGDVITIGTCSIQLIIEKGDRQ